MKELLYICVDGVLVILGLLVLRAGEHAQFRAHLTGYTLQFPYGTKPEALTNFLVGLTGLAAPRWRRLLSARGFLFEVIATPGAITHRLFVPAAQAPTVLAALRAHLPGVRVTELAEVPTITASRASQLGLWGARRPLKLLPATTVSTGLLAAMQPLADGEVIILQTLVQPTGPVPVMTPPTPTATWPWSRAVSSKDDAAAERAKRTQPLFLATPRIGVTSGSAAGSRALLTRMSGSFHAANAPGVHFFRRALPNKIVGRSLIGRHLPLVVSPCLLNAAELAMVIGAPLGDVALPGLRLGGSRLLAPSVDVPRTGRVVAESNFPGSPRPLALSVTDSLKHLHVVGPTGVGKSTLLLNLITQDMQAGHGVIVIDPKGDLAAAVIDRVPRKRVGDVAILDAADEACPVGFNVLSGPAEASELLVEQVVGVMHSLFKASWGPRTDDILRAALLTLIAEPGMTLCEVPLILTDSSFRRRLVGRVDDPVALGPFWAWYEGLSEGERTAAIGPLLNKLRQFLLRRKLRNILGQATPRLDLADVVRERRVLIVPLTKGLLGEEAAALLGSLAIARLWQTVMTRAGQPATQRQPIFAYIDEFQDYLHLPTDVADVLAQARGFGLGLTLAHQHLGQLPAPLREAVLANARSRIIFQTASADARRLGREVTPHLTPADLQGLGPYEVAAVLAAGDRIAPPATGRTLAARPPTGLAAVVREHSRRHYGMARTQVETVLRARHEGSQGVGRIGRQEVQR